MKLTTPLRTVEFGNLGVFVRGIITYSLSPYHLKAFDNPLRSIPRIFRRCFGGAVHCTLPVAFGWWLHDRVEKKYDEMNRKDPKDYENDT